MCMLPYENDVHRRVAAGVWTYLLRTFPAAEISAADRYETDAEGSLREDRELVHQAIVFEVSSGNPEHDAACPSRPFQPRQ